MAAATRIAFECASRKAYFRRNHLLSCLLGAAWIGLGWQVKSNMELLNELEKERDTQLAGGDTQRLETLEQRRSLAEYILPVLPLAGLCFVGGAVFYARRTVSSMIYDPAAERIWLSTFDFLGSTRTLKTPVSVFSMKLTDDIRPTSQQQYLRIQDGSAFSYVLDHEHGHADPEVMRILLQKSASKSNIQFMSNTPSKKA